MALFPLGILSAAGAGGVAGDYELIQTQILGSNTPSITFSNLGEYSSTYKHLQIRFAGRATTADHGTELAIRFNSISTNSYSWHYLRAGGNGSNVSSSAGSTTNGMFVGQFSASLAATNNFGAGVIDILDAYSTTKNKTVRGFSGFTDSGLNRINLYSGSFQSTNSTTSLIISTQNFTDNIITGSRFSLYGIRG
jgi:hypothetical protein